MRKVGDRAFGRGLPGAFGDRKLWGFRGQSPQLHQTGPPTKAYPLKLHGPIAGKSQVDNRQALAPRYTVGAPGKK